MDEQEQLKRYRETGDLQVLAALYTPYMSLLYGVCFKYLQDQDASQDAVMHIFEELVQKLRLHEVDHFKSWLYAVARNHCLMELRKGKNKQQVDIEQHLPETEQVLRLQQDDSPWLEQDFEQMEGCLRQLSSDQQRCVRLFYLEQKCYKDIAETTGLELSKVKSHIQNGKRNLKICMEGKNHGK